MAKNNMETLGAHPKYQKVQVPLDLGRQLCGLGGIWDLALRRGWACWMLQERHLVRTCCRWWGLARPQNDAQPLL